MGEIGMERTKAVARLVDSRDRVQAGGGAAVDAQITIASRHSTTAWRMSTATSWLWPLRSFQFRRPQGSRGYADPCCGSDAERGRQLRLVRRSA